MSILKQLAKGSLECTTVKPRYMAPRYMTKPLYMAAYPRYNVFFVRLKYTRLYGGPCYMVAKAL